MYILTSRETEKIQITQTISNHRTPTKITKACWKSKAGSFSPSNRKEYITMYRRLERVGWGGGGVGMVRLFWFYNDKIYLIPQ